jgi:transcription elongation factor Elf1
MGKRVKQYPCPECAGGDSDVVTGYFTKKGYLRTRVCNDCGCRWQMIREPNSQDETFVKVMQPVLEIADKATEEMSNQFWALHGAFIRAKNKSKKQTKVTLEKWLSGLHSAGERIGVE